MKFARIDVENQIFNPSKNCLTQLELISGTIFFRFLSSQVFFWWTIFYFWLCATISRQFLEINCLSLVVLEIFVVLF